MSAADSPDLALDDVQLADGVSEERATGMVAVYDTRELRYRTGPMDPTTKLDVPDGVRVTRSGRYQLRRV